MSDGDAGLSDVIWNKWYPCVQDLRIKRRL